MMKRRVLSLCLGLALCAAPSAFAARSVVIPSHGRHIPELDGPAVRAVTDDGQNWIAWSYRNGSDFDIAVAEFADGAWSEPVLLDSNDGLDQVEPVLATDASGNLYLAYTVRSLGVVRFTVFSAATRSWSPPVRLSAFEQFAGQPSMQFVGDRLVVAFREGGRVRIVTLEQHQIFDKDGRKIVDGPDPINGSKK